MNEPVLGKDLFVSIKQLKHFSNRSTIFFSFLGYDFIANKNKMVFDKGNTSYVPRLQTKLRQKECY